MATNLALNDQLINEAKRLGQHKSKKAAVTMALKEYIARMKQMKMIGTFGSIEFDPDYNYKKARKR